MVIRMRHTRSHTRNRRAHHGIQGGAVSACPECGAPKMAHRACGNCGVYRGRKVVGKKETEAPAAKSSKKNKKDSQAKASK